MQEINWAYDLLRNARKRAEFDSHAYSQEPHRPAESPTPSPEPVTEDAEKFWSSLNRAKLWSNFVDPEFRFIYRDGIAALVGVFFVIVINSVILYLGSPERGFISGFGQALLAIPFVLTLWLIAIFPLMDPDRRWRGLVGTVIGLTASVLVYASYTLALTSGDAGSESFIAAGQFILLAAIPVSAIGGSMLGMTDNED